MKKFFNWVLVLAACAGAFYGIGFIVPRSMTRGCRTIMTARSDEVYEVVADLNTWPAWNPDIRSVTEQEKHNDNAVWRVTPVKGLAYNLEVAVKDEPTVFQVVYSHDGSRYTLRFTFTYCVQIHRTIDTADPWLRAKGFLLPGGDETGPVGLLTALAKHMGEEVKVEEK